SEDTPDGWLLPYTAWWMVLGHAIGFFMLVFWQHIRELWQQRLTFLDRLCIPQDDAEKKSQCIYGLASFLNKSDDLIVLWSPRYFSRLWCTYEIACFLMHRKEAHRIHFLPVQISIIWVLAYFSAATTWLSYLLAKRYGVEYFNWVQTSGQINLALMILLQTVVLYPPLFYLLNQMLHDMARLPGQLRDFDIRTAQCFCCSHNHRHPSNGAPIQCDRQLIYGVLQMWSGSAQAGMATDDQIQRAFKRHLDRHLRPSVEQAFTNSAMLMRPLMSAAALGSWPFMYDFIAYEGRRAILIWQWGSPVRNIGLTLYILFWMPIFIRCLLLLGNASIPWWSRPWCRCVVVACQAMATFVISGTVVMAFV
ncbi:unnamed protein product, partial [Symbiodinium pilosum]